MTALRVLTAVLGMMLAFTACAEETASSWRFSGYGTVGAVVTNTDELDYRASVRQSHGATRTPDWGVDSRLGAQAHWRLNPSLSAVAQVLTQRRDGAETPRMEWLFGQAQVSEEVSLRAGRMVLPVFLHSDARSVGYAQHWLRTPAEVYLTYPFSSFDGAQAQWRPVWRDVNFTVQLSVGQSQGHMYVSGLDMAVKMRRLRGLNVLAESGDWTYRFGATTAAALGTAPGVGVVADQQDSFYGVGVQYDDGRWLGMAEYTWRRQSDRLFNSNGAYVSGGRRWGAWMPYGTLSAFRPKGPFYSGAATGVTAAAGIRWDVVRDLALKTQYESLVSMGQGFIPGQPDANVSRLHVFSVAADFVF